MLPTTTPWVQKVSPLIEFRMGLYLKLISSSNTITVPNLVLLTKIAQFTQIYAPYCRTISLLSFYSYVGLNSSYHRSVFRRMIPYSRLKLSDFYTLSQTKVLYSITDLIKTITKFSNVIGSQSSKDEVDQTGNLLRRTFIDFSTRPGLQTIFFHLKGHTWSTKTPSWSDKTKLWSDITKNKSFNFIHCCRKMIYEQKIARYHVRPHLGFRRT